VTASDVQAAREWQRRKLADGLAGLTWSREHGGQGQPEILQVIWYQESVNFDTPEEPLVAGEMLAGPTLIDHGSEDQRARYLPSILAGDALWCQLFSEPEAGSDLAGIRTRAVRDGDGWRVTGHKVWTSGAQHAAHGLLLCRTDPTLPKHRGLTFMILDMDQRGVRVEPLRQLNGESHFNEVFLEDAFVPDIDVVGRTGDGWQVAMATLGHERLGLPMRRRVAMSALVELAVEAGSQFDEERRAVMLTELAAYQVRAECLRLINDRLVTALATGEDAGPWGSVGKLVSSALSQSTADFAMRLLGPGALWRDPAVPDGAAWQDAWMDAPSRRIAGGTDEIQRTVIGERILRLPTEPRVDRGIPFEDIPAGPEATR
jgi:alkylation response protein AidB-like acyl-CoA dehydrogenase